MRDDLEWRFNYHPPKNDGIVDDHQLIRDVMLQAAIIVRDTAPESWERSLAYTKLEEAMFWANAAIARIKNYEE